jgi:WD40 repeat protein
MLVLHKCSIVNNSPTLPFTLNPRITNPAMQLNQLSFLLFIPLILGTTPFGTIAHAATPRPLTPTQQTTASLWQEIPLPQKISYQGDHLALRPDGQVVAEGDNRAIRLWKVGEGTALRTVASFPELSSESQVGAIAFSPDGKILAASVYLPEQQTFLIKLWDAESGQELRTLRSQLMPKVSDRNPDGSPRYRSDSNIVFSPDGKRLVSVVGNNSIVQVWDWASGKVTQTFAGGDGTAIAFSQDGRSLGRGGEYAIYLWDLQSRRLIQRFSSSHPLGNFVFNSDNTLLYSTSKAAPGNTDQSIQVWNVKTGQTTRRFGTGNWSSQISLSPDGKTVAIGGPSSSLAFVDLMQPQAVTRTDNVFPSWSGLMAFDRTGSIFVMANSSEVRLWQHRPNSTR